MDALMETGYAPVRGLPGPRNVMGGIGYGGATRHDGHRIDQEGQGVVKPLPGSVTAAVN
jgi:hypothetical protein